MRTIFNRACQELLGDTAAKSFADYYERTLPPVSMPSSTDSCAIALDSPKTAALCFDKVWTASKAPEGIRVFGGSPAEVAILVVPDAAARILRSIEAGSGADNEVWNWVVQQLHGGLVAEITQSSADRLQLQLAAMSDYAMATSLTGAMCARTVVDELASKNLRALPIYDTVESRRRVYESGPTSVVVAVLDELEVVNEETLEWAQVLEFRRDRDASRKYRRLIRWLDAEMISKTSTQIADAIEERLDDYRWAIRKHGLQAVSGLIESSIDQGSIVAASVAGATAAYASGNLLAALVGVAIPGLKVAAEIINLRIARQEVLRGPGSEVAFVYEIRRRLGSAS